MNKRIFTLLLLSVFLLNACRVAKTIAAKKNKPVLTAEAKERLDAQQQKEAPNAEEAA